LLAKPSQARDGRLSLLRRLATTRSLAFWIAVYSGIALVVYGIRGWSVGIAASFIVLTVCLVLIIVRRYSDRAGK
jgi:hypothetical protein